MRGYVHFSEITITLKKLSGLSMECPRGQKLGIHTWLLNWFSIDSVIDFIIDLTIDLAIDYLERVWPPTWYLDDIRHTYRV